VVAVLVIGALVLMFYLGIQPPNDAALRITVEFFAITAVVWFGFERRRFKGPPLGAELIRRQAELAAAAPPLPRSA
jgi:VanZ family protein